ncbi:MAG: UvrD-helicase domain-containing protein [Bacteroidales bacterium]|jgi:ATP-dependent exoDNAse (exonuclease V) beta subunit|nr:UvrD-helicase domain-containing protein [Bacteroidales bacterium]
MSSPGKLLKYSASAGSGKTHALTGFYLSRVLNDPGAYRRILAVTFTNSAAAEMKSRILRRLYTLGRDDATGDSEREEFVTYLCKFFPETYPDTLKALILVRKNAPLALSNILQDYSRFTVGTIDSFFQRVIRAFAREMDIPAGYEIELEHEALLSDAVDSLLSDVATDKRLLGWISSYVASRLDDNKGWDIRREIMDVAKEIFRENFRQLSADDRKKIGDYKIVGDYSSRVFAIRKAFESDLRNLAAQGVDIYQRGGLSPDDFLSKRRGGVGDSLMRYSRGEIKVPNSAWGKALTEGKYFAGGATPDVVSAFGEALNSGLSDIVSRISDLFERGYPLYLSALAQVRTIHVIGILGAISEKVREKAHEQNLFLLSDSGELINKLIADDDTPFIYEKIGEVYDHYIIDEFQDTSRIQWNNFRPLIHETLSRGRDNLVVGDVKQSIYRWRNGDWRIIHKEAVEAFGAEKVRTIQLNTNYRSRLNIIRFNNHIFDPGALPALCDARLAFDRLSISDVYSGSGQEGTPGKPGGYVRVMLYAKSEEEGWKKRVLMDIPSVVEQIQDHGYRADDILFLCRTNDEGKEIISRILEHSASCTPDQRRRYNYEITSGESLYLERNPAVTLLLSCLRYLTDPGSRINRSMMVRSLVLATGNHEELLYSGDAAEPDNSPLPEGWEEMLESFRNASLFTAVENMIRYFSLGDHSANVAYLSSFQDLVLNYSGRHSSDISSFVGWWDDEGYKSTISQSERQEAMRVMTIHKAKGLQSKVVIIPFAAWDFSKHGFGKPLLWVTDVPAPFAPMPVVLPERSNSLEESLFAGEAMMEKASDWLDGVNLLYVAFTRAVDALWVMAPEMTKGTGTGANAGRLLNEALTELPGDFRRTEKETMKCIECGEFPAVESEKHEPQMEMEHYHVTQPRGTLRLRTGGALPHDEIKLEETGGRAYGIMMHELLSMVKTTADIEAAAEHACNNGLLPLTRRAMIISRLHSLLSSDRVREWFDGSCEVMTEATIILPSGAARRPDRVMIKDNNVVVVDYKFGEPSPRHRQQAASYRQLLGEMGYKSVKSWLWYVEKDIIEEV